MLWRRVKKMMDDFKFSVGWDERHFIGVHIRRTDLAITQPDVSLSNQDKARLPFETQLRAPMETPQQSTEC